MGGPFSRRQGSPCFSELQRLLRYEHPTSQSAPSVDIRQYQQLSGWVTRTGGLSEDRLELYPPTEKRRWSVG